MKVGWLNPYTCTRALPHAHSRSYTGRLDRRRLGCLAPATVARASSGQPPSSTRGCPPVLGHPRVSSRPSSAARVPLAGVVRLWPRVRPRLPARLQSASSTRGHLPSIGPPARLSSPDVVRPPATHQPLLQVPADEDPGSPTSGRRWGEVKIWQLLGPWWRIWEDLISCTVLYVPLCSCWCWWVMSSLYLYLWFFEPLLFDLKNE
jgi:hypothetical protein